MFADVSTNRVGINQTVPDVSLDLGANTDAIHVPSGTTGERPGSPAAGYFRYNSETGDFEGYTDAWGAIAGSGGTAPAIDTMTGDGSDTTLTLTSAPVNENATVVTIDGVVQHKDTYSVSSNTLTFSTAPPTGTAVECITWTNTAINSALLMQDADGDTQIQVEESSDEDKIRFDTAGTERMVINNSGNVGIGTTSPAAPLSIEGSSTGEYDALILRNSNAAASGQSAAMIFEVSSGTSGTEAASVAKISGLRTGSGSTGDLLFHTTNAGVSAEAMRIDSSGNLLLNTTSSPTTTKAIISSDYSAAGTTNTGLTITGRQGGNWYNNGIHALGASGLVFSTGTTGVNGADATNERMRIDSSGNTFFKGSATSNQLLVGVDNSNIFLRSVGSAPFLFQNNGAGTIVSMLQNGNVGIGTDTPQGRVDIRMNQAGVNWTDGNYSEIWDSATVKGSKFNDTMLHINTNRAGGATGGVVGIAFSPGWQGHQNWGIVATNNTGGNYTQGDLSFVSQLNNGSIHERMRLKGDGNVGIGTTSPSSALDVVGTVTATAGFTTAANTRVQASSGMLFLNGPSALTFEVGAGSEKMRLTSTGLGIGTSSPAGPLHLYQAIGGVNTLTLGTGFGSGNTFAINPFITGVSNGGLSIRDVTNGADRLVIQYSTGNVGIGTDAPSEKLHVSGNILATGNITAYSDRNLKENIEPILNAVEKVQQLNGVTYNRNDLEDTTKRYAGIIAQDLQAVLPEAVEGDSILRVDYNATIGLLIEAIKELQVQIDKLKAKLKEVTK